MKIKLLGTLALSSALLLTACGQEEEKEESKPKEEQKKTDETQAHEDATNNNQHETNNTISPQDAEQIVSNYYINRGSNGLQAFEFKTNMARSNANEYYVEHLVRDAAGTPVKFCAVVNRRTGVVVDRFNDMSEEEMAEFEEFKKRSPKYRSSDEKENTEQENSQPVEQQEEANNPAIEQTKNEESSMNTPSDKETKE